MSSPRSYDGTESFWDSWAFTPVSNQNVLRNWRDEALGPYPAFPLGAPFQAS